MSMLGEVLGAAGTPHSIEFHGKRYTFSPITFGLMETLEVYHFEQAKKRLQAMKGLLDEDAFERKALDLYELFDAGEFGFLSERGQKWLKTPAGASCLLKLSLGVSDEELLPLIIQRGDEIKQVIELVLKDAGLQADKQEAEEGQGQPPKPFRHHARDS